MKLSLLIAAAVIATPGCAIAGSYDNMPNYDGPVYSDPMPTYPVDDLHDDMLAISSCGSNCTTVKQEPLSPLQECNTRLLAYVTAYHTLMAETESLRGISPVCEKPPAREEIVSAPPERPAVAQPKPPRKIVASGRHRRPSDCKKGRTRNSRGICGVWN